MVEPPEAQTQAIAFSSDSLVITVLGPQVLGEHPHHQLADLLGDGVLLVVLGRDHRRAAGRDPERLERAGHRVGGELAAAGAGPGRGDVLERAQLLVGHVAGAWAPIASKTSTIVTSLPCQRPGAIEPP